MRQRSVRRLFEGLILGGLMLFCMAGARLVPFHGDEATILSMAQDWWTLTRVGVEPLFFRIPLPEGDEELRLVLRLLNGTLAPLSYGIALDMTGFTPDLLPAGWNWGIDWWENLYYGHLPQGDLLLVARWASVMLTWVTFALIYACGRLIGGWPVGLLAVVIYATLPDVLVNGRRAMFEGAAMLGAVLVLYAGLWFATRRRNFRFRMKHWLWLGALIGISLASKHLNAFTVVAVGLAILLTVRYSFFRLMYSAAFALLVFLFLNPAWWSRPLDGPTAVLTLRGNVIEGQREVIGVYQTTGERLSALIAYPFGTAQYFEQDNSPWGEWIGDQIRNYENAGLMGIPYYAMPLLVWLVVGCGVWLLLRAKPPQRGVTIVILLSLVIPSIGIFVSNPLPVARYYLPLCLPYALIAAYGILKLIEQANSLIATRRSTRTTGASLS